MTEIKKKERLFMDRREAIVMYRTLIEDWPCAEEISERFKTFLEVHGGLEKPYVECMHTKALQAYSDALYFDHHRPVDRYRLFVYVNALVNELQKWFEENESKNSSGFHFENQIGFLIHQVALVDIKVDKRNFYSGENNPRKKLLNTPETPYIDQVKNLLKSEGKEKTIVIRALFHDYLTTLNKNGYTLRGTEHEAIIVGSDVDSLY